MLENENEIRQNFLKNRGALKSMKNEVPLEPESPFSNIISEAD